MFAIVCAGALQYTFAIAWAVLFWLLAACLIFLFRDPERQIPPIPLAIVSPIDGRVLAIGKDYDPFLERDVIAIHLRMSKLGTYATRSPTEGKIVNQWVLSDEEIKKKRSAVNRLEENQRKGASHYAIWVQTDELDDIVLTIKVKRYGFRPQCYVQSGERIGQGMRCGFVRFGATMTVYVPENSRVEVSENDKIIAGSDVIATLIHQ